MNEADTFAVVASYLRFHRLMIIKVRAVLNRSGLSLPDYLLLMRLETYSNGAAPVKRLARDLLVHPTTASLTVERLAAADLVSRNTHPADRRLTVVSITASGSSRIRRATEALTEINFGLSCTSPQDHSDLTGLLGRLRNAVAADGGESR